MSMYRQLWLALILSTLLAVIGGLFASTLNARAYLQEQLRLKNTDNATALALSLSHAKVDSVEIELAVAAMFDSGHYESIRVLDPFGKPIVQRVSAERIEVPGWFMHAFPIVAPAGEALISDGWRQVGRVSLLSHSRFAYKALWKSTLEMLSALAFAGMLGASLGTLILRRLKRPLDAVIEQAKAITERRFITCPEPAVPELRQLASAMNFAVLRLKAMFEEETARLESVRKEANHDALTGLANRAYFLARLGAALESDEAPTGSVVLVRVGGLADINRRLGRAATDQLLCAVAKVTAMQASRNPDAMAARLNGADFAILLPGDAPAQVDASPLLNTLLAEIETYLGSGAKACIGLGEYARGMDLSDVLAQIDTALAAAEASGTNSVRTTVSAATQLVARSAEQWSELLRQALARGRIRLASFPVVDFSGQLLHNECPLRLKFDTKDEWQAAGQFLPMAERLDMTMELDLAAVSLGLDAIRSGTAPQGAAVNLSGRSIRHADFRHRLAALLKVEPDASRRLWLEIPENGALSHFDAFREFCNDIKTTGCKIGVEHFGRQFSHIGQFHGLAIDYLKIDASFVREIDRHSGNQIFLKGLSSIAQSIGLLVIAEGAATAAELEMLKSLGFGGATGPAVKV